jgi:hypothetical protein
MPAVSGLDQIWTQLMDALAKVIAPDWGAVVDFIPLLLAPLVGLFLFAMVVAWLLYGARKPRTKVRYVLGPRPAEIGQDGAALFPAGYPFDAAKALVYPAGATRGDDDTPLTVTCPMCRVERTAELSRCGSCGLVLRIDAPIPTARAAGPPPGGAAVA